MENLLIPLLAAGLAFVVFLYLLLKIAPKDDSRRKKNFLGRIAEETRNAAEKPDYEVSLLKEESTSVFLKLPVIRSYYALMQKADIWEKRGIFLLCTALLFVVLLIAFRKLGLADILLSLVVTWFLSQKYLKRQIEKHSKQFIDMFPDAIDMIVRSVRSGHPLNTAMRMIADNMESPVRDEFKKVIDEVSYGRSTPDALRRMAQRVPEQDVNFFVVVISVQQETGGSLTEVLTNLSGIIRKRKQLRAKIRALTSEGRATSYILGAIPVVEFSALYFLSPGYLDVLFTRFVGNIMLAAAIALIIASQITVRAMINIDI